MNALLLRHKKSPEAVNCFRAGYMQMAVGLFSNEEKWLNAPAIFLL